MAHQMGVGQVVATLGTALNVRHVQHLRRFVPKVVLVFDADAGGSTGVDRALEIFVSQNVDLAIAALPEGKDPCDLLVEQGAEPFRQALTNAVDALDFKLDQLLTVEGSTSIEGRRKAVEAVLSVIALAPEIPGEAGELIDACERGHVPTGRGEEFLVRTPMRRFGNLEELVGAALFLASDAASFVTGHMLVVDGGIMASGVNQ